MSNVSKALNHLEPDEKGITTGYILGVNQNLPIINESGMSSLVLKSRKPEAKRFKKSVTNDVLPRIHQTRMAEKPQAQAKMYLQKLTLSA
jgi:anti-repressor protein